MQTVMDPQWDDSAPIYRQLRDRVVVMILEGVLKEGDALPSVRSVAVEFHLNPLTVLKGYQQLVEERLVEKRRGRGMFVSPGALKALMKDERQRFPRASGRGSPPRFSGSACRRRDCSAPPPAPNRRPPGRRPRPRV